jgi:hypothetical protein
MFTLDSNQSDGFTINDLEEKKEEEEENNKEDDEVEVVEAEEEVVEAEVEEEEDEDDVFMTVSEAGNCNSLGKTDDEAWSSRATAMAALVHQSEIQ